MFCLVVKKGEEQALTVQLLGSVISIGSHPFNDIQLDDPSQTISRFHAALFKDEKGNYHLQDLGSKNGVLVNGKRTIFKLLQKNDEITVGEKFSISFQDSKNTRDTKKDKPVRIISEKKEGSESHTTSLLSFSPSKDSISELEKFPDKLSLLYRLSHEIINSQVLDAVLQNVLEEALVAIGAEIGFIARGASVDALDFIARVPDEVVTVRSRTLVSHVLLNGAPVITRDALSDTRFRDAGSVLGSGIRSAAGIPFKRGHDVMGLLYMDSRCKADMFSEDNLAFIGLLSRDIASAMAREEEHEELVRALPDEGEIVGISPQARELLKTMAKVSTYPASVLITGETGVGKELVARAIHKSSGRLGRFIGFNCAALPEALVESELFGYRKGSHSAAFKDKKGLFEAASGGTIFLDEIGELVPLVQAKMLKAIEDKEVWPLGATEPVKVDVRIISATNKDLRDEVRRGTFRADLYQRLKVVEIHVPPLRQRKEDIPVLAGYFIFRFRQMFKKDIGCLSRSSLDLIMDYSWPGNIRELKNVIEGAAIYTGRSPVITPNVLKKRLDEPYQVLKTLEEMEKEHITAILEYTGGNKEKALKILDISKQTLYNKGHKYNLPGFEKEE